MKIQSKPDYLIFADDAKTGELDSFPNILRGWGITIDQTQSKPPMEWMNGAFNRVDKNMLYLLQQGVPEWNKDALYPAGAIIKVEGSLYKAKTQNINQSPMQSLNEWDLLIKDATTSNKGVVQLSSAVNSVEENQAATSKAVKTAYDLANNALKVGDYGVGSSSTSGLITGDISRYFATGFYIIGSTTTGNVPHALSNLIIHRRNTSLQTGISISYDSSEAPKYGVFTNGKWIWREFISTSPKVLPDFKSLSNNSGTYIAYGAKVPNLATLNAPEGSGNSRLSVTVRCDGLVAHYEVIENVVGNARKWIGECYLNSGNYVLNWTEVITTANINLHVESYPIGIPQPWPTLTPPSGWIKCNGATFDKTKYPKLALAYPSGKLPDLRGEFIRGLDDGRGIDSGRTILSNQEQQVIAHKHVGGWGENLTGPNSSSNRYRCAPFGSTGVAGIAFGSAQSDYDNPLFYTNDGTNGSINGGVGKIEWLNLNKTGLVGSENRPRNIAFLYIVKAE